MIYIATTSGKNQGAFVVGSVAKERVLMLVLYWLYIVVLC